MNQRFENDLIEALLAAGADVGFLDDRGMSALMMASESGHEVIRERLEVNPNERVKAPRAVPAASPGRPPH